MGEFYMHKWNFSEWDLLEICIKAQGKTNLQGKGKDFGILLLCSKKFSSSEVFLGSEIKLFFLQAFARQNVILQKKLSHRELERKKNFKNRLFALLKSAH